ncbi:MAG: (2Fe-2S) ferredoxin domain-containing protein [Bacteroidales bacterium]|jgi:NADP-reducing hydrogenase subunit HndB|nr:(2Fe-2S) ferredoxin domain-containing protein [Bacteroidales bacterium]
MDKIKSLADLQAKKESLLATMAQTNEQDVQIKVAMATCGIAAGAKEVMDTMSDICEAKGVKTNISQTGCMGYCYAEPTVEIKKPGKEPIVFGYVNAAKAKEIVEKYILNDEIIEGVIPQNYQSIDN